MKNQRVSLIALFITVSCLTGIAQVMNQEGTTVTDIDGNVYTTVKIGNQIWTVENLRTTKYNDGTSVPLGANDDIWSKPTPHYCWYANDVKNKTKYGALYNWYAVNTGKLSPKGWHVPSKAELDTLQNFLIAHGFSWGTKDSENNLAKSMASQDSCWDHWSINEKFYSEFEETYYYPDPYLVGSELSKNNRSGFSAIPGGFRNSGGAFFSIGEIGDFWNSTKCILKDIYTKVEANYKEEAYCFGLCSRCSSLDRTNNLLGTGISVRLIKDK